MNKPAVLLLLCLLTSPLSAATFTVTSANDSGPGTLRQAILDANAAGAGPHIIRFAMPGSLRTIGLVSPLPILTATETLVDATTQPGYAGAPVVMLHGGGAGEGAYGLRVAGAGSKIRGFVINGFSGAGVYVTAPGVEIMNNYIGLGMDGVLAVPNQRGVVCADGCRAISIGSPSGNDRNVISGNAREGISLASAGSGNRIRSNYIGTDATGTLACPNFVGIGWADSDGRIGDLTLEDGNVISGNMVHGILVAGATPETYVHYNRIGIASNWTPLGNGNDGVSIAASGVYLGENLIAYNRGHGVTVAGTGHEGNTIRHNHIHSNGGRAIALGTHGSTMPNDLLDADAGYANNLQNHPVVTQATWDAGTLTARVTLHSTPHTSFTIDLYSNESCDGGIFGEAANWHRAVEAITGADGNAAIDASFPYAGTGFITATATHRSNGDTSELSQCRVVLNAQPSSVEWETATLKVIEGRDEFATLTLTRSGSTAGPASVEVVPHGGSGDYLAPADSRVAWEDGDGTPKTVRIPIVADDLFEQPEEFSVEVRNATGATLGATTFAQVTIEEDLSGPAEAADLWVAITTRSTWAAGGHPIGYEINVRNMGPNTARGATLTNVLPPQLLFEQLFAPPGWSCTTPAAGTNGTIACTTTGLPAGNGSSVYFHLSARVAFDATGTIVNTATVTHLGSDPDPSNSTRPSEPTVVQATSADVSVTKTANQTVAPAGSGFTYEITIRNAGPDVAYQVTMTDVLPPQLQFLSRQVRDSLEAQFSCTSPAVETNGTVTCTSFQMQPGTSVTIALHVRVAPDASSGIVRNTATVTTATGDPDLDDHQATAADVELTAGAALSIHKYTDATTALPDSIFDYVISIDNRGPSAATDVVVTDVLPAGLLFERAGAPGGFTCTGPAVGTNGTVTCTAPTFPANRGAVFSILVRVAPDATGGAVTNTATVTSSATDHDVSDNRFSAEPVTIAAPARGERAFEVTATAHQTAPQVAATAQNALAVWRQGSLNFTPADGTAAIRGALFRPEAPGEILLDVAAPERGTDVTYPAVAAAGDRYLVVWRETRGAQGRILARRLRADGSFADAQPLVLETGPAVACCTDPGDARPAVASGGSEFYVTWVSAARDVRGIVVPAQGPVAGTPLILSRDADAGARTRFDLEVVRTPAMYVVFWLDRRLDPQSPVPLSFVPRYARVTPGGVLLDPQVSNEISGPEVKSITATAHGDGFAVVADYDEPSGSSMSRTECLAVLLLDTAGEPYDGRTLHCESVSVFMQPALRSRLVPVSNGMLLVQPGRRFRPTAAESPVRTFRADPALTTMSEPKVLEGLLAREASVTSWYGGALLVYTRAVRDAAGATVLRTFAYLVRSGSKGRAVRH
ncbi:MAG TPA: hypothetical protein VGF28_14390 [Thermoanaerobaculia bacterium]